MREWLEGCCLSVLAGKSIKEIKKREERKI